MPVGGAPTALRAALLGPRSRGVSRQRILKQLAFRSASGAAAPVAEVPVLALTGLGQRAALKRQRRRLMRQKPRLPQRHRCAAAGGTGTDADRMPGIGDVDMLSRPRARSGALDLIHLAAAPEPGKEFYYCHEPACRCGQRNNPGRCNQPATGADGSTGSASRQPLCRPVPRVRKSLSPRARGFPHMGPESETLRLEGGCSGVQGAIGHRYYRSGRTSSSRSASSLTAWERERTPSLRLACST